MKSLLVSRRDLDFLLYEWLNVEAGLERPRFRELSRADLDAVMDLSELIATKYFANHNKKNDSCEPRFVDGRVEMIPEVKQAYQAFAEAGMISSTMDSEFGGMQLPQAVGLASFAWFQAANPGSAGYPMLTIANANLLLAHGGGADLAAYVQPMIEGRFAGTMCLSEPQAGSSLADVATRAVPQADGSYRLTGNKMWISGGEHDVTENIVHLVLARVPDAPAGVKGLSLFIVPKYLVSVDGKIGERNDVSLAGLNHKMGYRGTVNTMLNFGEGIHTPGDSAGAVGYLVGAQNSGLKYMFHMMNEARVGVGLGAAAIGYTSYLHALDYARNRPQGRDPLAKDPTTPQVPIIQHADVRRMLLASKSYVEGALALSLYCGHLLDEQETAENPEHRERATLLLDVLTPIAKSWPSQWCLEANSLAIQIHGGYGYTREYNVEQFYRDNRLNAIHEGTHGIQALDLLGRKVVMQQGEGLRALLTGIAATVANAQAAGGDLAEWGTNLQAAATRLGEVTERMWGSGQFDAVLANATPYLEAFGHVVVAWIWLGQALAAEGNPGDFYDGKRQAAQYFFTTELPKTGAQFDLLASLDRTSLEMADAWF
jgi:alkylation response protein AidB-like acyl-CoA dehydrogenase